MGTGLLRAMTAVIVASAVLALSPLATARTGVIGAETRASKISAYGGHVVWSHYDAASSSYWLVTRKNDKVVRLPVEAMSFPFDVDLGSGPSGETVAVYLRCAVDGTNCGVRMFGLDTGVEAGTSIAGRVSSPTVSGSRIAFVAGGRAYYQRFNEPTRHKFGRSRGTPGDIDLDGARLVSSGGDEVWLTGIGRSKPRLIARGSGNDDGISTLRIGQAWFGGSWIYLTYDSDDAEGGGRDSYLRYNIKRRSYQRAAGEFNVLSAATAGNVLFFVQGTTASQQGRTVPQDLCVGSDPGNNDVAPPRDCTVNRRALPRFKTISRRSAVKTPGY